MVRLKTKSPAQKRSLLITLPVLLVGVAVAHALTLQIATSVYAKQFSQVKDDVIAAPVVDQIAVESESPQAVSVPVDHTASAITTYIVKQGDTLSGIAAAHGISINTIRWANDLTSKSKIAVGQKLTILPVSGIEYTVKKGDTISGIAKRFDADIDEILNSNDLENAGSIKIGMVLVIPDAEPLPLPTKSKPVQQEKKATPQNTVTQPNTATNTDTDKQVDIVTPSPTVSENEKPSEKFSIKLPIKGAVLTQGYHAIGGVDFGAPIGTPIFAAEDGTVLIAKQGGYNGGFGSYIVIDHGNGTQTLYAHLSKVSVSVGDSVSAGDVIGKSGNSGRSTGPHLHFEVRGSKNPFTKDSVGTRY